MLDELLARVRATQPALAPEQVAVVAAVALLITWSPFGYRMVRHVVTLVHEAGHALIAALAGRKLRGIRLHSDTSGLTLSRGRPSGPGMVATLLAGYPAPTVLGLVGAWVLGAGHAAALLWGAVLACAVVLLLIRNLYGLWVVLATGVAVGALSWFGSPVTSTWVATVLVCALLLAAPRSVFELAKQRRRGAARGSDADQLARLTRLPALLWVGLFALLCLAGLVAAGWLLLRP